MIGWNGRVGIGMVGIGMEWDGGFLAGMAG